MVIVDSHCHLDDKRFEGADPAQYVAAAAEVGVEYMQTICTRKDMFENILGIANRFPKVFCSFGIHPHYAGEEWTTYEDIVNAAQNKKVIGIGESGLDYFYDNAPRGAQADSFVMHLDAARELDMPVIIHTRDAEEDTIEIVSDAVRKGSKRLLFHCFTSNQKLADFADEFGVYMSASGIVTFKKSTDLQETFKGVRADKLLVETDSPYLAPPPHRGKTNQPAYTKYVAEFLAEIRETSLEEVAAQTTNNFFELFSRAER